MSIVTPKTLSFTANLLHFFLPWVASAAFLASFVIQASEFCEHVVHNFTVRPMCFQLVAFVSFPSLYTVKVSELVPEIPTLFVETYLTACFELLKSKPFNSCFLIIYQLYVRNDQTCSEPL